MSDRITGRARDHERGIAVEVTPGGALRSIELAPESLRLGRSGLATAFLDVVRLASAEANQRARFALGEEFGEAELSALGLGQDATLTEEAEATMPETWRA
jgi:hypothetical protein